MMSFALRQTKATSSELCCSRPSGLNVIQLKWIGNIPKYATGNEEIFGPLKLKMMIKYNTKNTKDSGSIHFIRIYLLYKRSNQFFGSTRRRRKKNWMAKIPPTQLVRNVVRTNLCYFLLVQPWKRRWQESNSSVNIDLCMVQSTFLYIESNTLSLCLLEFGTMKFTWSDSNKSNLIVYLYNYHRLATVKVISCYICLYNSWQFNLRVYSLHVEWDYLLLNNIPVCFACIGRSTAKKRCKVLFLYNERSNSISREQENTLPGVRYHVYNLCNLIR